MYQKKFVGVVKVRGNILREHDGVVTIPFGEEYSIFLKNLNSVKAVVSISIDGQDVLKGNSIIVGPNKSTEIEGFLDGMKVSNKFKFIQKTKQIQDYRGDKIDDGIIRIEYKFEKVIEKRTVINEFRDIHYYDPYPYLGWHYHYHGPHYGTFTTTGGGNTTSSGISSGSCSTDKGENISYTSSMGNAGINNVSSFACSANLNSGEESLCSSDLFKQAPLPDEGITVKGNESNQYFNYGFVNELEDFSEVITLKLVGTNSKGIKIEEPIIVTKKLRCPTCGKVSRSSAKFCRNCGTSLI